MQQSNSQLPSNAKRLWGEEKNIDSIYTIYLKKISYTYNNGVDPEPNDSKVGYDEPDLSVSSVSSSFRDDTRANQSGTLRLQKVITAPNENPTRGRQNFFQKYRRRSCSVDKYSFEYSVKSSNLDLSTSSTSGIERDMKYRDSSYSMKPPKKQKSKKSLSQSQSLFANKSNNSSIQSQLKLNKSLTHDKSNLADKTIDLHKSTTELSTSQLSESQFLQWETRQIKVLQAATLDHVVKFILLIKASKDSNEIDLNLTSLSSDSSLEEERNNVAHIIHVLFCSYRIYSNPHELLMKLTDYSDFCRIEQFRFVIHYWMDNYPEDFDYIVRKLENGQQDSQSQSGVNVPSLASYNSITSCNSSNATRNSDSETSTGPLESQYGADDLEQRMSNISMKSTCSKQGTTLVEELLRLCKDDFIRGKAFRLMELKRNSFLNNRRSSSRTHSSIKKSSILDMDSRYVAQQLTAIDLENFLSLRPYALLEGSRADKRIQRMVKNFNLLSKHVVVTTLKSHSPHIVVTHWISIAMNLRKIKNFNSLKAIIAGLTNESIYRLKNLVWTKISKSNMTSFKLLASIVDDVNNQTVLRQTQLVVEGTAKMNMEDDSFGTIPYLGTFLTDLNMIDARYPSYVPSPKDETSRLKLINFEKCAKQFEILTQVQLLQKNVVASLQALQRRNHFDDQSTLNGNKSEFNQSQQTILSKPAVPQVSKLFENWFFDNDVASMTDKQW